MAFGFVALLVVAILAVVAFGFRLYRVTNANKEAGQEAGTDFGEEPFPEYPDEGFSEFDEFGEFPMDPLDEFDEFGNPLPAQPEGELVDLIDYFADAEEPPLDPVTDEQTDGDEPEHVADEIERQFDLLCNLPTGRGFLIDCQYALSIAQQNGQTYAVAYFDYDRFRFINSLKGFSIGDYVLQKTVQELREIFPENAMMSRLSADHFLLMFPYSDEQQLQDYVEQMRRAADRIRGDIGAKSALRICMGVALTGSGESSYDICKLMNQANIARHCQKLTKNNSAQYLLFDPSMAETFLYGESALEDYTENQYGDDFELYFQPQNNLKMGRITSSEALARWGYEDNNTDLPPTADNGRMPTNNLKVVYHAVRAMSRWRKAGNDVVPVMVNLSVLELYKEDIDAFFMRCLNEFQIAPKMVTVIVDVHAARMNMDLAHKQLSKLAEAGLSIAICDIERGYQSLDFLATLPVKYIKVNKGFVKELPQSPHRQESVQRVLAEAQRMNKEVIFEGVDFSNTAALLKDLGAGLVQGGFAGKASKADEFVQDLQEHLQMQRGNTGGTVVLNDEQLARGELRLY